MTILVERRMPASSARCSRLPTTGRGARGFRPRPAARPSAGGGLGGGGRQRFAEPLGEPLGPQVRRVQLDRLAQITLAGTPLGHRPVAERGVRFRLLRIEAQGAAVETRRPRPVSLTEAEVAQRQVAEGVAALDLPEQREGFLGLVTAPPQLNQCREVLVRGGLRVGLGALAGRPARRRPGLRAGAASPRGSPTSGQLGVETDGDLQQAPRAPGSRPSRRISAPRLEWNRATAVRSEISRRLR